MKVYYKYLRIKLIHDGTQSNDDSRISNETVTGSCSISWNNC